MYSFIQPCLFQMDPEKAHWIAMNGLKTAYHLGLLNFVKKIPPQPKQVMGLIFPNMIGLAAGLDNNGDYLDALGMLGFGFIEIGGITPKPQVGNPKPRLFRLTQQHALINRKGFPNKGVDYVAAQLAQSHYHGILGINITKNRDTPNEEAANDYITCLEKLWVYASYFTINISSPNTPNLKDLQKASFLTPLLRTLKQTQLLLTEKHSVYRPLVVKISPDLLTNELNELTDILLEEKIDGIIATNTTTQRDHVSASPFANEAGGLSGQPLDTLSTSIIQQLHQRIGHTIPIIASGGIMDKTSARSKLAAGASLLQVYTGLIYRGPDLLNELSTLSSAG